MFTGHETTARTVSSSKHFWLVVHLNPSPQLAAALWELAKTRSVQEKLRAEVTETLGKIRTRGDSDFSVNDFDSMPYLIAFGKVCSDLIYLFGEEGIDIPPAGSLETLSHHE